MTHDGVTGPAASRSTVRVRRALLILATSIAVASAAAAALAPAARAEIDGLMAGLEASACQFSRNGTWYTAAEAKAHLMRKLKYLEDSGRVGTAEQFIDLAASSSSMTAQPYLVRCGSAAPVPSGTWLRSQLQAMRSNGPTAGRR